MRTFLFLIALAISATPAMADWTLYSNPKTGQQSAACSVVGAGPEGPVKATLVIHHRRGQPLAIVKTKDSTEPPILLELCVDNFESVKAFDFLAFEGPDATTAEKRLVEVIVESGGERFDKHFSQGGWINQLSWLLHTSPEPAAKEPHDFTFGIGDGVRDVKDFIAITDLLQRSPTKIQVIVTDPNDPKLQLKFDFPTDKVAEVVGTLMKVD